MNDELSPSDVVVPEPEDLDETPTQADPPKPSASSGVWAMPEPVFKKTSGYLPQAYNKPFDPSVKGNEDTTVEQPKPDIAPPPAEPAADAGLADVEPQPDVLAELGIEPDTFSVPAPEPEKKGIVGRILMLLFAFVIIILMAAVVFGVVWFVLWPRPDATIN